MWCDRPDAPVHADMTSQSPDTDAVGPIRLLVVDDHAAFRSMLIDLLSIWDDIEVVGECEDGSEVLEAAERLHPDVVLMDLSMPVVDGDEATRILHAAHPDLPVVMLTAHGAAASPRATAAGADALVSKDGDTETLLACLRSVVRH